MSSESTNLNRAANTTRWSDSDGDDDVVTLKRFEDRRERTDRRRTRNHHLELRARHQGISLDRRQVSAPKLRRLREARIAIAQWWGGDSSMSE